MVKITPNDIRQKQFSKQTLGGLNKDEVLAYLATLSQQVERMQDVERDLREKLAAQERETAKLREIESSLYKTLKTAEETGQNMMEQARQSSMLQLREADLKSESILKEARWQAKSIIEESRQEARRTFNNLQDEVAKLEEETRQVERLRDNMLAELRSLATDTLEKVERHASRSKAIDFAKPVTRNLPDYAKSPLSSPELEAAMADATSDGPASATPSHTDKTAMEERSFFDTI